MQNLHENFFRIVHFLRVVNELFWAKNLTDLQFSFSRYFFPSQNIVLTYIEDLYFIMQIKQATILFCKFSYATTSHNLLSLLFFFSILAKGEVFLPNFFFNFELNLKFLSNECM